MVQVGDTRQKPVKKVYVSAAGEHPIGAYVQFCGYNDVQGTCRLSLRELKVLQEEIVEVLEILELKERKANAAERDIPEPVAKAQPKTKRVRTRKPTRARKGSVGSRTVAGRGGRQSRPSNLAGIESRDL